MSRGVGSVGLSGDYALRGLCLAGDRAPVVPLRSAGCALLRADPLSRQSRFKSRLAPLSPAAAALMSPKPLRPRVRRCTRA